MRRCVGAFEILAVGWVALFVAAARPPYAVAVSLAALVALVCVRPLVVYWRTCAPAWPRGWWFRFTEPRRSDGTVWGMLVVVCWTSAAVGAVAGDVFAVMLGLVGGLLAWGAMWVLVRRLLGARVSNNGSQQRGPQIRSAALRATTACVLVSRKRPLCQRPARRSPSRNQ